MSNEPDNHGLKNELDYLRSIKRDDSYTFTCPFEYIAKNHGNDNYDIGTAGVLLRVQWNDSEAGYSMTHDFPDMQKIDPAKGNGDAASFHETDLCHRFERDLDALGIGAKLRAF